MIKICEYIIDWLLSEEKDNQKKRSLYLYVVYRYVSTISFSLVIGFVSLFVLKSITPIIFSVFLIALRKYSGGYHLNNADVCFINSIFIAIIAYYISQWLADSYGDSGLIFFVISVAMLSVIVSLSPVNHPNLHLTKKEAKAMKIRIAKISAIISAVMAVSAAVKSEMLFPIFVAIMTDFILIAAAKLTHQETKYI